LGRLAVMYDLALGVTLEDLVGPLDGPYADGPYALPQVEPYALPELGALPTPELVRSPTGKIHKATRGWAYAPPWDAVVGQAACGHDVWISGTTFAPGTPSVGHVLHPSTAWKREPFEQVEVPFGAACRKCFRA
jgi:hypothetical protein